jgi:hypothetical protein
MHFIIIELKLITKDFNPKHTNITAIYNPYVIRNYLQKILQILSMEALVERSKVLLRESASA